MLSMRVLKILLIAIIGLSVTLSGGVFSWYNALDNERNDAFLMASKAVRSTEYLLDEAKDVAYQVQPELHVACTPDIEEELSRLAISIKHLRVITLFNRNNMTCSSFHGMDKVLEERLNRSGQAITMLSDNYISPGEPVIVLRTIFQQDSVSASMATQWIAEKLRLIAPMYNFSFHAGSSVLTKENKLSADATSSPTATISVASTRYPFTIQSADNISLTLSDFISKAIYPLSLSLLIGLLLTTALWFKLIRRKKMSHFVVNAINCGEILPWYQPVINVRTNKIAGVEVLARWITSSGQLIMPDKFIPVAEEHGLIIPLTQQLMYQASMELPDLLKDMETTWNIAFNFTQTHILNPDFTKECQTFLNAFQPGQIRLTIELTEREPFESSSELKKRLEELHCMGIAVALDDFGTGYSNLDYLNEIIVDYIKIDRSFVTPIGKNKFTPKLLCSMITLATALHIRTIAEGIETREQAEWLCHNGVDYFQGYLFSPPINFHDLRKICADSFIWKG